MALLSRSTLGTRLSKNRGDVSPDQFFIGFEDLLPADLSRFHIENDANCLITDIGVDITLGEKRAYNLSTQTDIEIGNKGKEGPFITIPPRSTISVESNELIKLGTKLGGLVTSKVRMVSYGYSHISTTIDPGWDGRLILTFTNTLPREQTLKVGHKIATMVLFDTVDVIPVPVQPHEVGETKIRKEWARYADEARDATRARNKRRLDIALLVLAILAVPIYDYVSLKVILQHDKEISVFANIVTIGGIFGLLKYLRVFRN